MLYFSKKKSIPTKALKMIVCIALSALIPFGPGLFGYGSEQKVDTASAVSLSTSYSQRISASNDYSMAVQYDGTLWGWGYDDMRHLGFGKKKLDSYIVPKPAKIMSDVKAVSAGKNHTLAIKKDGSLWAWGYNLPNHRENRLRQSVKPVKIMDGVKAAACGIWHSLVIKNDGTLWAWGKNYYGQVNPDGKKADFSYTVAAPIKLMSNVKAIYANEDASYAIQNDGTLWGWGYSRAAYSIGTPKNGFEMIAKNVRTVSAGEDSLFFIKSDDSLWCYGQNEFLIPKANEYYFPQDPVKVMTGVKDIAVNSLYATAIKNDGSLLIWGWGFYLKDIIGKESELTVKKPYRLMTDVLAVSNGAFHSLVLKKDGSIWAWGNNKKGAVGDGVLELARKPVKLTFPRNADTLFLNAGENKSDYLSDYIKELEVSISNKGYSGKTKASSWIGNWDVNLNIGDVQFKQEGKLITFKLYDGGLKVRGTASGNRLKGTWHVTHGYNGIFELIMSDDGKAFKGYLFQDCAADPEEWTGIRK